MKNNLKINSATKAWVRRWAKETLTKLGYPTLGNEIRIEFRPMNNKVGLSEWNVHRKISTGKKMCVSGLTIYFSSTLWPYIDRKERFETVVHECCHLVDAIENDTGDDPHGANWIKLMARLGHSGEPTCTIEHLSISREAYFQITQRCNICHKHGHNAQMCNQKNTDFKNQIDNLFKE